MAYHKNITKIYLLLWSIACPLHAMLQNPNPYATHKRCYDLMIVLDVTKEEEVDSKNQAMGDELVEALAQKTFPILVSTNLVYNMCINKPDTSLTDDVWYCFDHPNADIMLFIPKNYIKSGLAITRLKKIDNVSPTNLLHYLQEKKSTVNTLPIVEAIESLFVMPTRSYSPTWNIYLTGHGANKFIAGLPIKDFFELLSCFQKINTSFLHYCSCYSGGANLTQVKEQLVQLNVNFIVSAQGINEEPTYARGMYQEFFKRANAFFENPYQFVQIKKEKDPIAFVISPLIDRSTLDYSQPFVYIPAVGVFNALAVDKEVKVITDAIAQAHTFENVAIDCTNPHIKTIIMYPQYVSIPIKIGPHIAIVSPNTQKAKDIDLHFFEKMMYEDTLSSVIFNCVSFNFKYRPTVFVIKRLRCFNYPHSGLEKSSSDSIVLQNVIIYCGDIRSDGRNRVFNVFACFDFNEKSYKLELLKNKVQLEGTADELFKRFENVSCTEITETSKYPNPIDNLPYALLDYQPLADLLQAKGKKTRITFAEIVHSVQEFNKPEHKEAPGALKRVLLKKQLESATMQASELPAKLHRDSHEAYLRYLQRLKEKVNYLEEAIKTTPIEDQSKKQALNDLKTIIDKELSIAFAKQQSEKEQQGWTEFFSYKIKNFYDMLADYKQPIAKHVREITDSLYNEAKEKSKPR